MADQPDSVPDLRGSLTPEFDREGAEPPSSTDIIDAKITAVSHENYRFIRQFPATGGEADIWLVVRDCGYYIFKHYRLGIEPKREVLEKVYEISRDHPRHLVRIFQYGFHEGTNRWFEIQEYARNGTLTDFLKNHTISPVQFRTIVTDITQALQALHENQILHLDLKPSNILIRSVSPLNVILTDFGISTLLSVDLSRQITATKGTPKYWAPEQLGNVVGKEADYWALGVICLEIIQNRHPFEGMNHNMVLSTLSTQGIAVPADINPKVAHLLKGLLTRNPKKRWGYPEVTDWLSGRENIPVYYEGESHHLPETTTPYDFREDQFTTLKDLMYAFVQDPESWNDAKRHITSGYLIKWLEKIEKFGQIVEIDKYCEIYPDEDERLLYIAVRFNPDIPFTLYGKPLDIAHIARYLDRSLKGMSDEPERRVIAAIFSGDLSRIYQNFTGISRRKGEPSLVGRMFAWLASHPGQTVGQGGEPNGSRGGSESLLYEYVRILQQREEIGSPGDWNAKAVLTVADIRNAFLRKGYPEDAGWCEEELGTAAEMALGAEIIEPDLLVAIASVSEEFGQTRYLLPCLRKASRQDIRAVSLVFTRRSGIQRFRQYNRMRSEYESNLYSLSSEPWNESALFWRNLFFVLLKGGNFPSSLSVSERILEMNRSSAEGWAMRGVALARMGRDKEADYFLSAKIIKASEEPVVWQILGEYYAGVRQFDEAERAYSTGLKHDPSHKGCMAGIISVYTAKKSFRQIIAFCESRLAEDPSNQELLMRKGDAEFRLGLITQAARTYEKYISMAPADTGALIPLARCQIKLKQNSDAERSINTLLERGEQSPQVFRLKAYLLLIAGKVREAVSYLDRILQREPEDLWALRIKADAHIALREFARALICIDRILSLDSRYSLLFEKKGKILLMFGFFGDAAEAFRQAIDHGRISADLFIKYGDALRAQVHSRYGSAGDLDLESNPPLQWRVSTLYLDIWDSSDPGTDLSLLGQAQEWYERSSVLMIEGAPLWNRKGIIATYLRDFDRANSYFDRAINEDYEHPAYITNLAVMYLLNGKEGLATSLFLKSISKFSKNPYFLDQCAGFYYLTKGDITAALDLMDQAVKVNSKRDPRILYHHSILLRESGREDRARDVITAIQAIDPAFRISD